MRTWVVDERSWECASRLWNVTAQQLRRHLYSRQDRMMSRNQSSDHFGVNHGDVVAGVGLCGSWATCGQERRPGMSSDFGVATRASVMVSSTSDHRDH